MTNRFGVLFSCFRFLVFVLVSLFVDLNTGGGRRYTAKAFVYPNLSEYLAKNFVSSEIFVCASFRLLVSSATSTHRQTHTGTESGRESE